MDSNSYRAHSHTHPDWAQSGLNPSLTVNFAAGQPEIYGLLSRDTTTEEDAAAGSTHLGIVQPLQFCYRGIILAVKLLSTTFLLMKLPLTQFITLTEQCCSGAAT